MENQKVRSKEKTEKWFEKSIKEGVDYTLDQNNNVGPDKKDISAWYKLYLGNSDSSEVKRFFDDLKILDANYNPSFKQISTIFDRIELLHGEYIKRDEDYAVAVLDEYSINRKQKQRVQEADKLLEEYVSEELDEREVENKLKELTNENFKSQEEKAAYRLIDIVKSQNRFDVLKHEGFREGLITSGAVFKVYNLRGNTKIRKCDPYRLYTAKMGGSYRASDAEMIAEVDYMSPSQIIEEYSEYLTETQVENISKGNLNFDEKDGEIMKSRKTLAEEAKKDLVFEDTDDLRRFTGGGGGDSDTLIDEDDNIRVVHFSWKGYRLVYKRKRYVDGKPYYDYVSEHYEADEEAGEELEKLWIPEWHSGDLIGSDLVVNAKVNDVQYRSRIDPTICKSGYAGGYFNVGREKGKSVVGMASPILYLQDVIFAKIEDLISKNIGKVIELDLSTKPKDWTVKKWLYYMKAHNIVVKNRANELSKGMAQGKLAGMYDTGTRAVDMETADSINTYINLYSMLDRMLSKMTGISDQRLGGVDYKEPVGSVESSKIQSSYITEYWFKRYDEFMLELNSLILDSSRATVSKNRTIQGIMSDSSFSVLNAGDDDFIYADIGIFPVNTKDHDEYKRILKETAVQAIPNGQMTIDQLGSIFLNKNVRDMQDKLATSLKESREKAQKAREQEMQAEAADKQAERQHELQKIELEYKLKEMLEIAKQEGEITRELLRLRDSADSDVFNNQSNKEKDQDGIDNDLENEIARKEIELKERKQALEERKALLTK